MSVRNILIITAGIALPAFAQSPPPSFGPIQIGASVEQIRAATPGINWTVIDRWPRSGRERTLQAEAVLTLGGTAMRAKVMPGYHGQYHLLLTGFSPQANAAACQASLISVVDALGGIMARGKPAAYRAFTITPFISTYARYQGDRATGGWNVAGWPRPGTWRPEPLETPGKAVLDKAHQGGDSFVLQTSEMASKVGELTIQFYGGWQAGNICSAEIKMDRRYDPPPPRIVRYPGAPIDVVKQLTARKTLAELLQLHELLPIDAKGVTLVELECGLTAETAKLVDCRSQSRGTVPASYSDLAVNLTQIEPITLQKTKIVKVDEDIEPTGVAIQIAIDGSRRSDLAFLSTPALKTKEFESFTVGQAPPRPRDPGGHGTISFKCQVQADYSSFCKSIKSDPPALLLRYGHRAGALLGKISVSPTLKSGATSLGTVYEYRAAF